MAAQRLGQQENTHFTHRKDGERGWVRFKVCVSWLVSKRSQELVFRQHFIGHFIYSGKD